MISPQLRPCDLGVGAHDGIGDLLRSAAVTSRAHRLAVAVAEVVHVGLGRLARGLGLGSSFLSPPQPAIARASRHSGRRARRGMAGEPTTARSSTPGRVPLGESVFHTAPMPFRPPPEGQSRVRPNPPNGRRKHRENAAEEEQALNGIRTPDLAQDVHAAKALSIRRRFTTPGVHPFDTVEWELRDARIGHGDKVAFEQRDVEFPKTLVAERHEHRRPEVLPRPARLARARALGQADDRPRRRHDRRLGPRARLLRHRARTATPSRPS